MKGDEFISQAENPKNWLQTARQLKKSSDILFDRVCEIYFTIVGPSSDSTVDNNDLINLESHFESATLLLGLSVENALKGGLVKKYGISIVKSEKDNDVSHRVDKIGGQRPTHDLYALAQDANIFDRNIFQDNIKNESVKSVLEYLAESVRWGSKYPTSLKNEKREDLLDAKMRMTDGDKSLKASIEALREVTEPLLKHLLDS